VQVLHIFTGQRVDVLPPEGIFDQQLIELLYFIACGKCPRKKKKNIVVWSRSAVVPSLLPPSGEKVNFFAKIIT
jgi:hypothetical protein